MKPAPFELRRPMHQEEVLALLSALGSDAQILAGGQSLLPLLRYRVVAPHVLLDINRIDTLGALAIDEPIVRIGALVRHAQLEQARSLRYSSLAALLAAHAREIAFWAVRNRGTAVGSIVQADPKGDWPLLFCALDAQIELASSRRIRSARVRDFIEGPLQSGRAVDELATAITLSEKNADLSAWGRAKLMHRAGEYAVCSAIALRRDDGWHCWLGAVGDRPQPLSELSQVLTQSKGVDRNTLVAAARSDVDAALAELPAPQRHRHAVNAVDAAERALRQATS